MSSETHLEFNTDRLVQEIRFQVQRRVQQAALTAGAIQAMGNPCEPPQDLLQSLESALCEVEIQGGRIGQPTPEPPTVRGRIGSKLMRVMGRLLWWYTYHVQALVAAIARCFREEALMLDSLALSLRSTVQAVDDVQHRVIETHLSMHEFRENLQRMESGLNKLELAHSRVAQNTDNLTAEIPEFRQQIQQLTNDLTALKRTVDSLSGELNAGLKRLDEELSRKSVKLDETISASIETERQTRIALAVELTAALGALEQKMQALVGDLAAERQDRDALVGELSSVLSRLQQKIETLAGDLAVERQSRQEASRLAPFESDRTRTLEGRLSELGLLTNQLRTELRLQERRISLLLSEARKRLPGPFEDHQLRRLARMDEHKHDALYLEFEDVYRGTREEIKNRQSVYLPLLREQEIGTLQMPVLDVGCGRGEWLEFLREHGLNARGVDINEAMVEYCRALHLDVTQADALDHLRSLDALSLGAVTAFHVVEHLQFDALIDLLDEILRVLKRGGMVILETPNPGNILVGAHTFYLDPTHTKPLPSGLLRFIVEARGFSDVSVKELHPPAPAIRLPEDESVIARRLNDYLYGPQDYAVIGKKL